MTTSRFAFLVLFVAACGPSGGDSPSGSPTTTGATTGRPTTAQSTPLPGVEIRFLDDAEKRSFFRIVDGVNSPCGQAMSISQCVREHASECSACTDAAKYSVRLLASGYPAEMTRELVKLRFAADTRLDVSTEGCTFLGNPDGRVTFVEFADFECPHCKMAHEMFEQLFTQRTFADNVRLCYRFFPLEGHQHARAAARAAVAAQNQGKFWQMHDLVYEHQTELSDEKLLGFATELGLDLTRFRTDIAAPETEARVARDRAAGEALHIEGTPTFFVNGRQYGESLDPDSIGAYVAEELSRR